MKGGSELDPTSPDAGLQKSQGTESELHEIGEYLNSKLASIGSKVTGGWRLTGFSYIQVNCLFPTHTRTIRLTPCYYIDRL
ncbi:hypothetical protein BDV3_005658 [Batrachochytrium dendrobatidis]